MISVKTKKPFFLLCNNTFSPPLHFPMFHADPETTTVARLSRAEAYMALKQYRLALEDTEFCSWSICSAEVGHSLILQFFVILCHRNFRVLFQLVFIISLAC